KSLQPDLAGRAQRMLAVAMTHAVDTVVRNAAAAVGRHHATIDPQIVHGCVAAIVERAQRTAELHTRIPRWNPEHHEQFQHEQVRIAREARELVTGARQFAGDLLTAIDLSNWRERFALYELVPLLLHMPESDSVRK